MKSFLNIKTPLNNELFHDFRLYTIFVIDKIKINIYDIFKETGMASDQTL
ncbi:MAG: hypothetical protein H6Q20_458 [Bacteroidetes bacterium]|jgi:hypothetical protein|nr:hypothetical protein [Bacteroidota bacterium]